MKKSKKILSLVLTVMMLMSLAAPVFAVNENHPGYGHPDFNEAKLREVILANSDIVAGISDYLGGLIGEDYIKGLIKTGLTGLLDLGGLAAGTAGPLLGDLIGGAIGGSLGFEIPDSIDLGSIINSVVNNEIVNGILTSDFLAKVVDKTIDNILDSLDFGELTGAVVDMLFDEVVDELVANIWRDGDPDNTAVIGHWINEVKIGSLVLVQAGWNSVRIGIDTLFYLGGLVLGGDVDIDYMALLPSMDVLIAAVWDAVVDTTTEYFETFKARIIEAVQAKIAEAKDKLAEALGTTELYIYQELAKYFGVVLDAKDTLEQIKAKVEAAIECYTATKEQIEATIAKLQSLKAYCGALPYDFKAVLCAKIESIIAKCREKCPDISYDLTIDHTFCVGPFVADVTANGVSVGTGNGGTVSTTFDKIGMKKAGKVTVKIYLIGDGGYLKQTKTWNGCSDLNFDLLTGSWDWYDN